MKLERKKIIIIGVIVILAIVTASWVWFTEPVTADKAMQDRRVTSISISYRTSTPGADGGDTGITVKTQTIAETNKVMNLMNQYPYSRRLFDESPASPAHYKERHMIWISLEYKYASGKPGIYRYLVYEDGYMQTSDSGEQLRPGRIGRFGTKKTKAFYHEIADLFQQSEDNPSWEKIDAS